MKIQQFNIEDEKKKNSFRVPEGYMEGLTDQIMAGLPERPQQKENQAVSMAEKMRPWLYLAAILYGRSVACGNGSTRSFVKCDLRGGPGISGIPGGAICGRAVFRRSRSHGIRTYEKVCTFYVDYGRCNRYFFYGYSAG